MTVPARAPFRPTARGNRWCERHNPVPFPRLAEIMRAHTTASSFLLPILLLAACGDDHPLAGNWSQKTADGSPGMSLGFDTEGDRVMVHTAPDADGHHDHVSGIYTWDGTAKTLSVKAPLLGDGKAEAWSGSMNDSTIELTSPDGKLMFQRGGKPHGH